MSACLISLRVRMILFLSTGKRNTVISITTPDIAFFDIDWKVPRKGLLSNQHHILTCACSYYSADHMVHSLHTSFLSTISTIPTHKQVSVSYNKLCSFPLNCQPKAVECCGSTLQRDPCCRQRNLNQLSPYLSKEVKQQFN